MVYPVFVVLFAVSILVFIMLKIVPQFQKIFKDFGMKLPDITNMLIALSEAVARFWYLLPGIPIGYWLYLKLMRRFNLGRTGWDYFKIKVIIFGQLIEKDIVARTMRTLGTLVASGVPILEALHITRETSGNAAFETMFGQVNDAIREGESIAKPMKESAFVLKSKTAIPALAFLGLMLYPIGVIIGCAIACSSPSSPVSQESRCGSSMPRFTAWSCRRPLRPTSATACGTPSSTTWWSTWSTWAKRRASWTQCFTKWPTRLTKRCPCSPRASRPSWNRF